MRWIVTWAGGGKGTHFIYILGGFAALQFWGERRKKMEPSCTAEGFQKNLLLIFKGRRIQASCNRERRRSPEGEEIRKGASHR